jgi:formiminotetrahydrofolate cyclodeaminase
MGFADDSIADFLEAVAAGQPTPGGGAVAAVAGAAGAALCEMVCSITDATVEGSTLADIRIELEQHRRRLLELADEDAAAIDELMAATQQSDERAIAVRTAVEDAIDVPMETAEACLTVLEAAEAIVEHGYPPAVGDAHTGALLAHGALEASLHNARVNLQWIEDAAFIRSTNDRIEALDRDGRAALEAVEAILAPRHIE